MHLVFIRRFVHHLRPLQTAGAEDPDQQDYRKLKEDDRDQQIQTVENFTSRRVSGLVLAPLDSQALVRPVESAAQARIPVVIIDSGLKSDKYVSFVATDNYKGGQLAGEQMGKLLGGKGNVILLRYAVGSASTEAREKGFVDVLRSKYPNIKIISSDQHAGATRETAYQTSQNILNRFGREARVRWAAPTIAKKRPPGRRS